MKEKNDKFMVKQVAQPKLNQINEILDTLRERKTISETNLTEALAKIEKKKEYDQAKSLLEKVKFNF